MGWTLSLLHGALLATNLVGDAAPVPITEGTDALECQWPSVVALLAEGDDRQFCSGSLIHPQVILTAAHCLDPQQAPPTGSIGFGEDVDATAFTIPVDTCARHPGYEIISEQGATQVLNDVGYCVLSEPVTDVPMIPVIMGCEVDELQPNVSVTIVGFGASSGMIVNGNKTVDGNGLKRFTDNVLETIDVGVGDAVMVGEGSSACFGDSGGPSIVQLSDGTWRIFGVGSTLHPDGDGVCGYGTVYEMVHMHMEWLETETALDLSPCFAADGEWDKNEACGSFPLEPGADDQTWPMSCNLGPVSGWGSTCGRPFMEEGTTGTSSDSGDSGGEDSTSGGDEQGTTGAESSSSTGETGDEETGGDAGQDEKAGCGCRSGNTGDSFAFVLACLGLLTRTRRRDPR